LQINKESIRAFRAEYAQVVAALEAKHGVKIALGNIRFTADEFRGKITVSNRVQSAPINLTPQAYGNMDSVPTDPILSQAMVRHGITRRTNAKGDVLTGYRPSRPKFCFEYKSVRGKVWLTSADGAKQRFG
jgi:hypothetical protein